jgi:sorbitol-specific phosphotransferase system component IIC
MDNKDILDGAAVFATVGAMTDLLPPLAALFTIIWTALRIYEMDTVQRIIKKCSKQ